MNTVRMILCGNVEDSRMNPSEKVGVVSVVFVSTEEEKIKNKLKKLQDKNPEKLYMEYVTPLDVDISICYQKTFKNAANPHKRWVY